MTPDVRFKVVLDTNVIFPIVTRDLLFWFAHYDLYIPKWSKTIFNEWKEVMIRKGIEVTEAEKRVNKANLAFPYALVKNNQKLIEKLDLPDEKDRHILATAIKSKANLIVTNNLKDFPLDYLDSFGLKAVSADDFLSGMIDLNPETAMTAFKELVLNKKKPKMNEYDVLKSFRTNGLNKTADYLQKLL